jgi:hypothetical protein
MLEGADFSGNRSARNYGGFSSTIKQKPSFAGNVTEAHK